MIDHPETEIQFVRRVIAMLLSLGGIAERAAKRSYPVRAFLLWILRPAEKAAQDFVGVEDLWAGVVHGNGPNDALDLADSFRELAAFLRDDLEQKNLFQGWWRAADIAGEGGKSETLLTLAVKAVIRWSGPRRPLRLPGFTPPRLDSS